MALMVISFLMKLKTAFGWPAMLVLWTLISMAGGVYLDHKYNVPKVVQQQVNKVVPAPTTTKRAKHPTIFDSAPSFPPLSEWF